MGAFDQALAKSIARQFDRSTEHDSAVEEELNQTLGAAFFGQSVADNRKRLQKSLREKEQAERAARLPQPAQGSNSDDALLKSLNALERLANGDPPPVVETDAEKIDRLSRENGILKAALQKKPKK